MYGMIRSRLSQGPFLVTDIIPLVRSEDRSLDYDSARMIAKAAYEELAQRGEIRIDNDRIYPAA
jgi:hypothetical protein